MENQNIYNNFKELKDFNINKKMITGKIVLYKESTLYRTDKTGKLEDGPLLKKFEDFYSEYKMRDNFDRLLTHLFGSHISIFIYEDIHQSKKIYQGIIPSDLLLLWKDREYLYLENDFLILKLLVKLLK